MSEDQSRAKVVAKAQLKRDAYKVFGKPTSDLNNEQDDQIFNDFDFYQVLLKDFLASNEDEEENTGAAGYDDDVYLDGADIGMTQKFIERRKKL